jgi:hypothetical protein
MSLNFILIRVSLVGSLTLTAVVGSQPASGIILSGKMNDYLPYMQVYSSLPFEEAKACGLTVARSLPKRFAKLTSERSERKMKRDGQHETIFFGSDKTDTLEIEQVGKQVTLRAARFVDLLPINGSKPVTNIDALWGCMGAGSKAVPDTIVTQLETLARAGSTLARRSSFSPVQIMTCMLGYPNKIPFEYEMFYIRPQFIIRSPANISVQWARSRSMFLDVQKIRVNQLIVGTQDATYVGNTSSVGEAEAVSLSPSLGWATQLIASCATYGDDRDVLAWPKR